MWRGFVSGGQGGYRGGFCDKLLEAFPMSDRARSKMDPPLAKANPISDGVSASVVTYLRRGKKNWGKWQSRERSEMT